MGAVVSLAERRAARLVRRRAAADSRWSPCQTVAFILTVCSPFWLSVACALQVTR